VVLGRSDATLVSCAELMTAVQSRGRFLGLHLPRAALAALVPNVEDAAISRIPRDTQALRLLVSYVGVLQDEDALATPELRRSVVAHIHDLAALAIGATRDGAAIAEGRGGRAARLRAIKLDIIDNLGRSDLTINALARRHRLQPRYIQRLFEFEGTTFSEFTMRQRLSRSYRMLADAILAGPSALLLLPAGSATSPISIGISDRSTACPPRTCEQWRGGRLDYCRFWLNFLSLPSKARRRGQSNMAPEDLRAAHSLTGDGGRGVPFSPF
jgi:AraC-like DNA-binding protein